MIDNKNNPKNENDFSLGNNNLEIVKSDSQPKELQNISESEIFKKNNFYINRLNIIFSPLKKRNEKYYQKNRIHLLADLFFGSVIIVLLVVSFYWYFYTPSTASLEVRQLSDNIISGAENSFEIVYANHLKTDINNATLKIDLPENFEITEVEPMSKFVKEKNIFNIGQINQKETGKVIFKGKYVGEINSHHNIFASLDYSEKKIKKNISEYLTFIVNSSILKIKVLSPDKTYSDSEFSGEIKLTNNSESDMDNIEVSVRNIEIIGGQDFQNDKLVIKSIKAGETVTKEFSGKLIDQELDVFFTDVYLMIGNKKILQDKIDKKIVTLDSPLSSNILCRDDKKEIECQLNLSNLANVDLKNFDLTFSGSNNFVITQAKSQKKISYEKRYIVFHKNFFSGEKAEIDLKFKLIDLPTAPNNYFSLIQTAEYEMGGQKIKTNFKARAIKLFSTPEIKLWVSYYNQFGDQIGSGPLPPKVGLPTSYWVFLEIKNNGDNLSNFSIVGKLPKGAIWIDEKNVLAGNLTWDEKSSSVSWTVNSVPTGSNFKSGFKVSIIPNTKNVEQAINLFEEIKYDYFDEFCSESVKDNFGSLTTDLK